MGIEQILLLIGFGLATGVIAGMVGIGGGAFFAPVLLFYFDSVGVVESDIAQMTIASSLFCSLVTASSSAVSRHLKKSVNWKIALVTGACSAAAILLTTTFITTQPWYGREAFQIIFSIVLVVVAYRMFKVDSNHPDESSEPRSHPLRLLGVGSAAGTLSAAVGVGGGVILVPMYEKLVRLPIHLAMGTSSATVILITSLGVVSYATAGSPDIVPGWGIGYVDMGTAALLALPAAVTAGIGVRLSHRFNRARLRRVFAVLVVLIALRLALGVIGVWG